MADNRSGIYRIVHADSDREYIGSAVRFRKRWNIHRTQLRQGKHHSRYLQRAYDKYGPDSLVFEVLEIVDDPSLLIECEQRWLDKCHPVFNTSSIAGSTLGVPCAPETRKKISAANSGRTGLRHTEEAKRLQAEAKIGNTFNVGRVQPRDEVERRAASNRGQKRTPEQRSRISEGSRKHPGHPQTPETRAKISKGHKGIPRPPHVIEAMNEGRRRKRDANRAV